MVNGAEPTERLRMLAIGQQLGREVGSDELIRAALDALLAGVDSPSLPQLAGLSRAEEPEARELFRQVVSELGLTPPADAMTSRWELVRWWCELIVAGDLAPEIGGELIWYDGWNELGYPPALQPLVGCVSEWQDWQPEWNVPRDDLRQDIVAAARQLLDSRLWPPAWPDGAQ